MLKSQHAQWAALAPAELRPLVRKIHGPLIGEMMAAMGYEDEGLLDCLQSGFPYVGPLPACGVAVKPGMAEPLGFVTPPSCAPSDSSSMLLSFRSSNPLSGMVIYYQPPRRM